VNSEMQRVWTEVGCGLIFSHCADIMLEGLRKGIKIPGHFVSGLRYDPRMLHEAG
jgi:hypothetical protein